MSRPRDFLRLVGEAPDGRGVYEVAGNPFVFLVRKKRRSDMTTPTRIVHGVPRAQETITTLRAKRIGDSWYSVEFEQARAGFRKMDGGSWGYYFRGVDGGVIGRQEYYCSSRDEATKRIARAARRLGWTLKRTTRTRTRTSSPGSDSSTQ